MASIHSDLPIVIDHVAKPRMGAGQAPDENWREGISALAALPNVWCILSGMITEIGPDWMPAHLARHAAHVVAEFGPSRLMWGSDWPVVNLAGDYGAWVAQARALVSGLSSVQAEQVFDGTARAFYGLNAA